MARVRPGALSEPAADEMAQFTVKAATMVVRRAKGEDPEIYDRGDTVTLSRGYADAYCRAGVLEVKAEEPKRLTGAAKAAADRKAAGQAGGPDSDRDDEPDGQNSADQADSAR